MRSSSAPASPACTCCTGCVDWGCRRSCSSAASGVGGTWYWNRYPGARCDIESIDYCYSFSRELLEEWRWTERYATQPEILRYLEHVADRFDLRRDIRLGTTVTAARVGRTARGRCPPTAGDALTAQHLVLAVGNLTAVKRPDFPGLEDFEGDWHHTARWPREGVELRGRRVAVDRDRLDGHPGDPADRRAGRAPRRVPAHAELLDAGREPTAGSGGAARGGGRTTTSAAAAHARATRACRSPRPSAPRSTRRRRSAIAAYETGLAARRHQRAVQRVHRPVHRGGGEPHGAGLRTREDPEPSSATRSSQRRCARRTRSARSAPASTSATSRRTTATTSSSSTSAARRSRRSRRAASATADAEHAVDVIVFAIGFDAMTGALLEIDIRGRDGVALRDAWADGPRTLFGRRDGRLPEHVHDHRPRQPVRAEQHGRLHRAARRLDRRLHRAPARPRRSRGSRPTQTRRTRGSSTSAALADATLYPEATSWYVGANIPGKPRVFMPYVAGCGTYRRECDEVAARGYEGFVLGAPETEATMGRRA